MAKLIMSLPPLLLLLFSSVVLTIAHASTYRTTVTTTIVHETSRRCREQIERQDLSSCERYLTRGGRDGIRGAAHPLIRRIVRNIDPAERCCRQLNEMDDDCQCEAMKRIMMEQGEMEGYEEMGLLVRRAGELWSRCGVETGCWEEQDAAVRKKQGRHVGSCREQIEREDLGECERHLREGLGGRDVFRGVGMENTHHLKGCCRRLERLDERCQCKGIEEMARRERERLSEEGEREEVMRRARELPDACDLRTTCEI
ncbi:2S seed storage albumin protein-like [Malania oleifera]|uniref:2S seed storage albumin protein-like n=1 Tax=Malania oleifera TaxID=397392 RepID=UPI0025AE709A|nr:2S seed storage albumin protein-like [Malania oleifera]